MRFKATGQLQVDAQGRLTGALALRAENWREILDLAERGSLLPPSSRAVVERLLSLFASGSGGGSGGGVGSGGGEKLNTTHALAPGADVDRAFARRDGSKTGVVLARPYVWPDMMSNQR